MEKYMKYSDYDNYIIGSKGSVYSFKTKRFLKKNIGNSGYYGLTLCKNGVAKRIEIHRLVALCHIPNPDNKQCVNHKDGDKKNNDVNNLEWVTYSENSKHARMMNLTPKPPSWRGKVGYDHNRSKSVKQFDAKTNKFIKEYGSMNQANKKMGYGHGVVHYSVANKSITRDGYRYVLA